MKDGIFMVVGTVGLMAAVIGLIVWLNFNTYSESVEFYHNNTIACVQHRPAGTWEYDIDQCVTLKATESAIIK